MDEAVAAFSQGCQAAADVLPVLGAVENLLYGVNLGVGAVQLVCLILFGDPEIAMRAVMNMPAHF